MKSENGARTLLDTTVNFLKDRQHVVNLAPLEPSSNMGYVWRRVFQRKLRA